MREPDVLTYNRTDLINEIAWSFKETISREDIIKLFDAFERNIFLHLKEADSPDVRSVTIRPFFGLTIEGHMQDGHLMKIAGKNKKLSDSIRVKSRVSRYFKDKLNNIYR